jgi:hypothetical protein
LGPSDGMSRKLLSWIRSWQGTDLLRLGCSLSPQVSETSGPSHPGPSARSSAYLTLGWLLGGSQAKSQSFLDYSSPCNCVETRVTGFARRARRTSTAFPVACSLAEKPRECIVLAPRVQVASRLLPDGAGRSGSSSSNSPRGRLSPGPGGVSLDRKGSTKCAAAFALIYEADVATLSRSVSVSFDQGKISSRRARLRQARPSGFDAAGYQGAWPCTTLLWTHS